MSQRLKDKEKKNNLMTSEYKTVLMVIRCISIYEEISILNPYEMHNRSLKKWI